MEKRERIIQTIAHLTMLTGALCASCSSNGMHDEDKINNITLKAVNGKTGIYITKAPFQSGNICDIYITGQNGTNSCPGNSFVTGCADASGNIIPERQIQLPSGLYDFYLVSANCPQPTGLMFREGVAGNLLNGVDYIWGSVKSIFVDSDTTLALIFNRLCSKLDINIKSLSSIEDFSVKKVLLSLPDESLQTICLINGVIEPYCGEGILTEIEGTGAERSFIILPKEGRTKIVVEIEGKTDGNNVISKEFNTILETRFKAGYSYNINLEIVNNGINLLSLISTPWRIVENHNVFNLIKIL